MPLSEHVYCLAVAFKMIEQVDQRICIKLCIKFEHFSAEAIRMIQKAAAMGNWWWAASSQQHTHSCITSCAVFWQNIKSPRWLSLLTAQIWSQNHLWKGRDFRPSVRFRKIGQGSWRQLGELCEVRSQGAYLKGTEASLSCVQCFLYLVSSSINVSFFNITWLDSF